MKVFRLNLFFKRLTDAGLEIKTQLIIASVDGNAYFLNPTPAIAELLESLGTFSEALTAAGTGDRIRIAEKNKARLALESKLQELAAYVMMVAKNDKAILVSSGFDLRKETEPMPPVSAPTGFIVSGGNNPGEVEVKLTGAKNVKHYRHEYTTAPLTENSSWIVHTNSRRTHLFEGLKKGTEYIFRSAGSGKDGALVYSNVVSLIVQ